jgi:hypothetical protein
MISQVKNFDEYWSSILFFASTAEAHRSRHVCVVENNFKRHEFEICLIFKTHQLTTLHFRHL